MSNDPIFSTEHFDLGFLKAWVGKRAVFRDGGLSLVEIKSISVRSDRLTISFATIPYPDRTCASRRIAVSADVSQVHADEDHCFGVTLPWHIDVSREAVRALRGAFDEMPEDVEEERARQQLWAAYQRHYSAERVGRGQ